MEADEIAKNDALIRFYYNVEPRKLSDNKWCKLVCELDWVLKYNGTRVENNGE